MRLLSAIAREPLELIAHVIRNERPFTEILTANYAMLNGYAALSMVGLPDVPMGIGEDPDNYCEVQVPGVPHAGILTSPMFLNRFPTSDTNINRRRSRMAYWFFLDIDINQFGSRPVDASSTRWCRQVRWFRYSMSRRAGRWRSRGAASDPVRSARRVPRTAPRPPGTP